MLVRETWVNIDGDKRYIIGDSDLYEPFTDDPGQLFRAFQKDAGRCTGKVYVDVPDGVIHIGWTFQRRKKYTDSRETYLQETWVDLHDKRPTRTVEYHYHEVSSHDS